ncbi:MAG TPA: phosphonate C-P lyase system protein PhnL [Hyphomicrobiales bacterium]|nr:phosphonate C-P lyase system protein PhnL [Kaistiaceae bacterium]HQF31636.1 phosphonate C-P lyase system protein PhnL [Hyphomicrobiales bacterium]
MKLPRLELFDVAKSFTLHLQGGLRLPVIANVSFAAAAGECVVLGGPSGAGKSSILKMVYGNYRCERGEILVHADTGTVDIVTAAPREIIELRRTTLGYVSQFLRVIPRVSTLDLVKEPLIEEGADEAAAEARAGELLAALNVPARLWRLPPATFSGGEQQRVNIARGFAAERPILLLDEPTASLDAANRDAVVRLIDEKKAAGTAIVGIFHDADVRDRVADVVVDVATFAAEMAA